MNTLLELWHLNGHGLYVWGSVGMCALALATEVLLLSRRRRALARAGFTGDDT
jgi:heme exporter protein D